MSKLVPIITNKIYIPVEQTTQERLNKHYKIAMYTDNMCMRCPLLEQRPCNECYSCKGFLGEYITWDQVTKKGKDYYTIPPGNIERAENLLKVDFSKAKDLRPIIQFDYKIKFTGKLFDGSVIDGRKTVDQKALIDKWMITKSGFIEASPGVGKTIISVAACCMLGVKTLIVAHDEALLRQFYRTFVGSKNKPAMTNVPELREKTGKKIVGIIEKMSDYEGLSVAITTYQKYIRDTGQARIKKYINDCYSLIIVDEAHQSSSDAYIKFLSYVNCKYRLALSATPERKDGKTILAKLFLGPVRAKATAIAMVPKISLFETGLKTKYQHRMWVYAMQFLAKNKERTNMIVRQVFKDLRNGHLGIMLPVDFKAQAKELCDLINKQARINNEKRNENWPINTAVVYQSGDKKKNEKILRQVDNGKIKVLVAIRSMVKQGIDLTTPSMLYVIVPMSASIHAGAPMFYQLSFRIARWLKDKKQPEIRIFVDDLGFSVGCFKSLFWKEIVKGLKDSPENPAKYRMDTLEFERAKQIASSKTYTTPAVLGKYMSSEEILKLVNKDKGKSKGFGGL